MRVTRLIIFGDSISTTNFSGGGYEKMLCEALNVSHDTSHVENHAVNAAALSEGYPFSVVEQLENASPEAGADCVLVWAGTNDWFYGVTLDEFRRSLEKVVDLIGEKYPFAESVICTPIWRLSERADTELKAVADVTKNPVGLTLDDYRQAVVRSDFDNICDMNSLLCVNEENHTALLRDGVHPSKLGYTRIAEMLGKFISNI